MTQIVLNGSRNHYALGNSVYGPGGIQRVVRGISSSQHKFGASVNIVDNIKYWKRNVLMQDEQKRIEGPYPIVNHFHFSWTFLQSKMFFPLDPKPTLEIFHFHGPWYLESIVQSPDKKLRSVIKKLVEKWSYSKFPIIISASNAFNEILVSDFKIPTSRTFVLPLGVDVDLFQPKVSARSNKRESHSSEHKVLGTVRRLVPRMGIELLIQAMSYLPNCKLQIAGSGPLERQLRNQIGMLGLSERVELIGYIPDVELVDFYNSIDLLIMPSLSLEGFGLTSLEAFACGVPVIGSDLDGIRESIGGFSKNLLFTPGSIPAIVDKVKSFFLTQNHSAQDYRNYAEKYSWDVHTRKLELVISERLSQE